MKECWIHHGTCPWKTLTPSVRGYSSRCDSTTDAIVCILAMTACVTALHRTKKHEISLFKKGKGLGIEPVEKRGREPPKKNVKPPSPARRAFDNVEMLSHRHLLLLTKTARAETERKVVRKSYITHSHEMTH
jgi:hypothetical protein